MNDNQFSPPPWMERREKQLFNRVQKLRKSVEKPLKAVEIPVLIDYVRAMTRIEVLHAVLDSDSRILRSNPTFTATKTRIIATAKQIDASTKLAAALWANLT